MNMYFQFNLMRVLYSVLQIMQTHFKNNNVFSIVRKLKFQFIRVFFTNFLIYKFHWFLFFSFTDLFTQNVWANLLATNKMMLPEIAREREIYYSKIQHSSMYTILFISFQIFNRTWFVTFILRVVFISLRWKIKKKKYVSNIFIPIIL